MSTPAYAPHQERVIQEKTDLDAKRGKLLIFIEDHDKFEKLDAEDQLLLRNQLGAMNVYSAVLSQRIARFVPAEPHPAIAAMLPLDNDGWAVAPSSSTMPIYEQHKQRRQRPGLDLNDDTPLAPACDLSADGTCEACQ